jgi:RNA polymerase sigma-70 factor, ECF subfamily
MPRTIIATTHRSTARVVWQNCGTVCASPPSSTPAITDLLLAWNDGDAEALDRLIPLVDTELHRLAHRHMAGEAAGHPLQTTALVNEAYVRLIDGSRIRWQNRAHFFAVSARLMRRILVDVARARHRQKRGADAVWISLTHAPEVSDAPAAEVIALDDALTALAAFDARKSRVVELRFFGGLTVEETAEALHVSPITVMRDWSLARAWLAREMRGTHDT